MPSRKPAVPSAGAVPPLNQLEKKLMLDWSSPRELTEMEFYAIKSTIQRRTKDGSYPPLEILKEVKQQAKESPFGAFDTPAWLEWRIAHPMGNFQPSPAQQPSHAPVGPSHSAPHTTSLRTEPTIKVEETETSTLLPTGQITEQESVLSASRKRKSDTDLPPGRPKKQFVQKSTFKNRATSATPASAKPRTIPGTRAASSSFSTALYSSSSSHNTSLSKSGESSHNDSELLSDDAIFYDWQKFTEPLDRESLLRVQSAIHRSLDHKPSIELLVACQKGSDLDSLDSKEWIMWRFGHHLNERILRLNEREVRAWEVRKAFEMLFDLEDSAVFRFLMAVFQMVPSSEKEFLQKAANTASQKYQDCFRNLIE